MAQKTDGSMAPKLVYCRPDRLVSVAVSPLAMPEGEFISWVVGTHAYRAELAALRHQGSELERGAIIKRRISTFRGRMVGYENRSPDTPDSMTPLGLELFSYSEKLSRKSIAASSLLTSIARRIFLMGGDQAFIIREAARASLECSLATDYSRTPFPEIGNEQQLELARNALRRST